MDGRQPDGPTPRELCATEPDAGADADAPLYVISDITRAVQHALARHGVPGTITYRSGRLYLSTAPNGPGFPVFPWASRWPVTDEASQLRRANDAARFLASSRAGSSRPSVETRSWSFSVDPKLVLGVALLCVIGGYLVLQAGNASDDALPVDRKAHAEGSLQKEQLTTGRPEDEARSSRMCAATRARVQQGGTVSVADVDGWQVEVALLKVGATESLIMHPALSKYVAVPQDPRGSKFVWEKERTLAPIDTTDTLVRVVASTLGSKNERVESLTLSFLGTLVDAYFKEEERGRYYHLAHSLSEDLGATHGALYARCFDDETHALGSWFRGSGASGASTALVYFMGTFASPIHIAKPFYSTPEDKSINRAHAFFSIMERTRVMDREALATVIGTEGGMATGKPDEPVIVTFPFGDGNRAARASYSLARVTSLR